MGKNLKQALLHPFLLILAAFLMTSLYGCVSDYEAQPYNETGNCWEEAETVGFGFEASWGCDQSVTITQDASGRYWMFKDSCILDEFKPVDGTPEMAEALQCQ